MRYLLPLFILAGCSTVSHETRSLICLGFCSEQRVEHKAEKISVPPSQPVGESQ